MRPSVSPPWIVKSMPSTALTHLRGCPKSARRTGKCLVSPRTSRMGSAMRCAGWFVDEPAARDAIVPEADVARLVGRTARQRVGAQQREGAARRQTRDGGRPPGADVERNLGAGHGDGAQ